MEEENLIISKDDDIPILAEVATYMRHDLRRNQGFYENITPRYSIDEFKSPRVTFNVFFDKILLTMAQL